MTRRRVGQSIEILLSQIVKITLPIKRICFDLETEQFCKEFELAKTQRARQRHAPKMRIACAYSEHETKYYFFTPHQIHKLITILQSAHEIITFNGKQFDLLVLRRHYKLKGKTPKWGKHIDLHEIISAKAGYRVSLHKAVKANFDESKHTAGRNITSLDMSSLKAACKSDVDQTYRLWQAYKADNLVVPPKKFRRSRAELIDGRGGPGDHMPKSCPICHDVGSLEFVELEAEEMTEGQFADYMAGLQGDAVCHSCNSVVAWEK